jgi:hypothetical protein
MSSLPIFYSSLRRLTDSPRPQTRRISNLAILGLVSGAIISFLHISLALTNFILAFVWNEDLRERCDWGVDVSWTLGDQGDGCSSGKWIGGKAWPGAAAVRLVVTIVFLVRLCLSSSLATHR